MKDYLMGFLSFDLWIQMAVVLAFLFAVAWLIAGKGIVKIMSLVPWGLQKIFQFFYMLVEGPICLLHKNIGECFYHLDNGMAARGKKTDTFLRQWQERWRAPEKRYCGAGFMAYAILLWLVYASYETDGIIATMYSKTKDGLVNRLEELSEIEEAAAEAVLAENQPEVPEVVKESRDIVMIVSTAKDPLSIRDIPSMEDCEILDRADRGSSVIWIGDLAFGTGDSDKIEPWAKVMTDNGIVGWARLKYLCPEDESDYDLALWIE
nr:SH3 domain-containing protein [uncultured Acetatifactor sp.]